MSEVSVACRICSSTEKHDIIPVREMMFGMRDKFDYLSCSQCGCLQLINPPENMGKYYPDNYYSLGGQASAGSGLRRGLESVRDHILFARASVRWLITSLRES